MPTEISASLGTSVSPPAPSKSSADPTAVSRQALPAHGQNHPPQAGENKVRAKDLSDAVSRIQDYVQSVQRELRFSIDKDSGRTVIKVVDSSTNKVIRQIPPKEVLAIAKHLKELQDGTLLRVKA